tara:strand:+ start:20914 stop:24750 length:3837 start_codon:yes stop_codon:yes gene_type:complete
MPKPWLMGIDLGGSGVRCLLVNTETGALAGRASAWRVTAAPGTFGTGFDIDLDELYAALGRAARDALAQAGSDGSDVSALAISAMRFSSVVSDAAGNALLAVPNNDARAAGECFEIADKWGEALLRTTGSSSLPMHVSARLLWLQRNDAQAFARAAGVYGCGEWLAEQLCGVRAMDATQASASGLFCLHSKDWAWELIDEMDLPRSLFPPIVESGSVLGRLSGAASAHLGLAEGVCVAMGGADTQLSLLGAAITEAGHCAVVAGTTAPVQVVLDEPVLDASGAMLGAHHAVPGRWVLESNSGAMGYSLSLLARTLFPEAPQPELRLFAEADNSEPGAAGMLSTLGADMLDLSAPTMPVGQLALSHMSCADDPAPARHLARAAAEGCACALRANRERLAATLAAAGSKQLDTTSVTLCGGLSRSDVFAQLVADIGATSVSVPEAWQTSALGAAICAGIASGLYNNFAQACAALCHERRHFAPRAENAAVNTQLFDTWLRYREQAQTTTAPVAVDHLLPRVLREAPVAARSAGAPEPAPRALISAAFDEASLQRLRPLMDVEYASFREAKRLLTGPGVVQALQGKQIFVTEVDVLDAAALQQLPGLRVVAACRGDAVNVDVDACTAFGVPVLYAPGRNAVAVADLTVAFILNLARKLPAASAFLRDPECSAGNMGKMGQAFSQLQGNELWGKTIGLVGLGAVGKAVARRLAGFEATLLVADPFVTPEQAALAGCRLVDLDTLLRSADFVSLHAAVTPATTGMLGAEQFARMQPGAFFINTARAALVDEQALVDALENGHLAGAALDTFAMEPPGFDHPLVQHPAVICTPHSAGNTLEVAAHQGASVSQGLLQLLRGERPANVLNPTVLDGFRWDAPRREPDAAELERLQAAGGPAVTDLQRDALAAKRPAAAAQTDIAAPTAIVEAMRNILTQFCADMAADPDIRAFSADQSLTLHFTVHDLGLEFYLSLERGSVSSALGAPPGGAEVQLQMRAEILDGMFTGSIDTMECAMNGEISFMGDAAKAMALQHMNADMERLYKAARAAHGEPGDLASIPRPSSAGSAPPAAGPGDLRQDLVEIMQELYESQVVTATGGNISVRIPDTDGELWITPSRLFKGDLKPEVMVRINLRGESLDSGSRSPSSEWCMHTRVLELKPEANAVIHAHAPNATILANSGLPFLPISTEAAFFGDIARIPFCMPGTQELADAVGEAMGDDWAVLMINHGILVAGRSLRRAADMVEIIERSAEIILGCHAVGVQPPVLPQDAAAHFRKLGDIVA